MTIFMLAAHRLLPRMEQYPLPPREITESLAERVGVDDAGDTQLTVATFVNHFAYGAVTGAPYGLLARVIPVPPLVSGIVYGVVVWSASYLGFLPAAGILKPATEHPIRRNALMIAAHFIWGGTLAAIANRLAAR